MGEGGGDEGEGGGGEGDGDGGDGEVGDGGEGEGDCGLGDGPARGVLLAQTISHVPLVGLPSVPGPHVNIGGGGEGCGGEGGGDETTHDPSLTVARLSKLSASGALQPFIT